MGDNLQSILEEEKINFPKAVRKRNNQVAEFDPSKISDAISYAFESVGIHDKQKSEQKKPKLIKPTRKKSPGRSKGSKGSGKVKMKKQDK